MYKKVFLLLLLVAIVIVVAIVGVPYRSERVWVVGKYWVTQRTSFVRHSYQCDDPDDWKDHRQMTCHDYKANEVLTAFGLESMPVAFKDKSLFKHSFVYSLDTAAYWVRLVSIQSGELPDYDALFESSWRAIDPKASHYLVWYLFRPTAVLK